MVGGFFLFHSAQLMQQTGVEWANSLLSLFSKIMKFSRMRKEWSFPKNKFSSLLINSARLIEGSENWFLFILRPPSPIPFTNTFTEDNSEMLLLQLPEHQLWALPLVFVVRISKLKTRFSVAFKSWIYKAHQTSPKWKLPPDGEGWWNCYLQFI